MVKVQASCPDCGEVQLSLMDIMLMICSDEGHSYYSFTCPECLKYYCRPAPKRIVTLLVNGGVRSQGWTPPAEVLEVIDSPRLGYDDLLDFALELQAMATAGKP